jgi:hypothetical protein
VLCACATGGGARPRGEPGAEVEATRALYEGRVESPHDTHRFRLALALAPPGRMRIEILPPVGGPRLVVISDGRKLLALDPARRIAELWDREGEGVSRLLGASLGADDLLVLLEGRSPCGPDDGLGLPDAGCAFAGGLYRPGPSAETPPIRSAAILDAAGTPLLFVAYPAPKPAPGAWQRTIDIQRPGEGQRIHLSLSSGPTRSNVAPALFSTDPPDRFEPGTVLPREGLATPVTGQESGS